ncbi:MAG: homoserine kinase [Clostridia bacterium]
MISVKVPASSANLGAGFDCMGVALKLYNLIDVEEISSGLDINILGETTTFLPKDEKNLVYQSMLKIFDYIGRYPKGLKINLTNRIPVTRGLGSSSACVAGGLFAANALTGYQLTQKELITMAAQIEGHPDNSTPTILGGMVVAVMDKGEVPYVRIKLPDTLKFAVFVPGFTLATKKARNILPDVISHKDGVFNAGRAALMAASMVAGNYDNIPFAVEDKLHQPYRAELIPDMKQIFDVSKQYGAKGAFLSGAGPSIIAILDQHSEIFRSEASKYIQKNLPEWSIDIIEPDNEGITVVIDND